MPHLYKLCFKKAKSKKIIMNSIDCDRVFRRFGQAKFAYGGSILGSSQF